MDFKEVKDKAIGNTINGLILAAGVAAGVVVLKTVKGKAKPWVEPLVALVPGLAMKIAGKGWVSELGSGFIAVGLIDGANKLTTSVPAVNAYVPKINGLGQTYSPGEQGVMGFRGDVGSYYTAEQLALMGMGQVSDDLRLVA